MKCETNKTPAGITTIATREDEALLIVEDRSGELERIAIDFAHHEIRVYSNGSWAVSQFKRDGTPIESDNPLTAVVMHFRDGAGLRQGFKTPVPQAKAMPALGRFMADIGGELDIDIEPE